MPLTGGFCLPCLMGTGCSACPDLSFVRFNLSKNEPESEVSRLESRPADRLTVHGGLMRAARPSERNKGRRITWTHLLTGINNTSHSDSHFLLYSAPEDSIHGTSHTGFFSASDTCIRFHSLHAWWLTLQWASSILWLFPLGLQHCQRRA